MAYLGNVPARSFISFERQVFTIVNSQTAYTLSHSVTNENDIRLVVNNVVQEPGSGKAYTATGTSAVDALGGATNSIDCLISVRMANILTTTITVEAYIERGGTNYHLIKNAPIVSGGSLELIDGGSKIVLASGDQLYVKSDTASSLDTVVGAVDDIST